MRVSAAKLSGVKDRVDFRVIAYDPFRQILSVREGFKVEFAGGSIAFNCVIRGDYWREV